MYGKENRMEGEGRQECYRKPKYLTDTDTHISPSKRYPQIAARNMASWRSFIVPIQLRRSRQYE